MTRFPLGIAEIAFAPLPTAVAARTAAALGFDHIDVDLDAAEEPLALPVACPFAYPPVPGWCSTSAPPDGPGRWEQMVRIHRAAPGALLEPSAPSVVGSTERVMAALREVPGLRLLVDTGHVADWGGDPLELLEFAAHVQLRQGKPGHTQLHVDDPSGVVDFHAVLARLDQIGYEGSLTVEYFDLPEYGWSLDDPVAWSVDLARSLPEGQRLRPAPATGVSA